VKFLPLPLCLLLSGCCVVNVSWNHLRVGYLDDHEETVEDSTYVRENTYGLYLKWAPDVDWSEVWSKVTNDK